MKMLKDSEAGMKWMNEFCLQLRGQTLQEMYEPDSLYAQLSWKPIEKGSFKYESEPQVTIM